MAPQRKVKKTPVQQLFKNAPLDRGSNSADSGVDVAVKVVKEKTDAELEAFLFGAHQSLALGDAGKELFLADCGNDDVQQLADDQVIIHVVIYKAICICLYMHIYVCVYVCICICIYMFVYICI